jgi:8-oxo-dGTP pyrophosphatase MutT (NUDIX family)
VSPAWKELQPTRLPLQRFAESSSLPLRTAAATVRRVKQSNLVHDGEGWETISSERHFGNAHLEVVTDHVRTPTRELPRTWTVVHRKAAVIIAPMTRDGKIVLIHQERVPIRAAIWEMPSGQIDKVVEPDEREIKAVALSELREEAGYELSKDGDLIALGHYFSSPGFTDERGYFLLARRVEPCAGYVRDESEAILDCREFSIEELRRMIAENEIRDANTLSMWARLDAGGFLSPDRR